MTEADRTHGLLAGLAALARGLWPALVALALALLALQPPSAAGPATGFALLPVAAVVLYGQRASIAFACLAGAGLGASFDVLAQGPVGFWALVYATGAVFGAHAREVRVTGFGARWGLQCLHLALLAALQAALVLILTFNAPAWGTIVRQSVVAALIFPILAWMIPVPQERGAPIRPARLSRR